MTTKEEFETQVSNATTPYVLVDFWAEWCGPCRQVSPILDRLATAHADKITLLKVDVDAEPDLMQAYDITSVPTFKLLDSKSGAVLKTTVGAKPLPAIEMDYRDFL